MSIKIQARLPSAPRGRLDGISSSVAESVMARWNPAIRAADSNVDNGINILEPIGYDPWTGGGVTARRISAALKSIGSKNDVNLTINSPGGDMFEGLAIYNLLREHEGEVNVKVVGVAASAASVIAMGGDNVQIARAGFFMVHNAWVVAAGNRNDLREYADMLEPFDNAMASIYAARTGDKQDAMAKLMDKETWIGGQQAVDQNFADSLLDSDQVEEGDDGSTNARSALYKLDAALARAGVPRSERKELLREYAKGMPSAALDEKGMPRAAEEESIFSGLSLDLSFLRK